MYTQMHMPEMALEQTYTESDAAHIVVCVSMCMHIYERMGDTHPQGLWLPLSVRAQCPSLSQYCCSERGRVELCFGLALTVQQGACARVNGGVDLHALPLSPRGGAGAREDTFGLGSTLSTS